MKSISLIGYAYGQAAGDSGCADGPEIFKQSADYQQLITKYPNILWDSTLYPSDTSDKILQTKNICQQIAQKTQTLAEANQHFIVMGGDHSSAIGTWSGVHEALHNQGNIGLIWIDAHMDSHTPETSPSGNIHGMPLAVLLGHGYTELTELIRTTPKLLPENVCLIGIRSFEAGEAALLKHLGVRIFNIKEVQQNGLAAVFAEALSIVQKNTIGFGISLDIDAIDPNEAPGVGTPAIHGLSTAALCESIKHLFENPRFIGAEIVEFNPHQDEHHKTEKVISDLIDAML